MPPTLAQSMRMSSAVAVLEDLHASQATCCSNSRVKREACSAQGTAATTTPCSGHSTLTVAYSTKAITGPWSIVLHLLGDGEQS